MSLVARPRVATGALVAVGLVVAAVVAIATIEPPDDLSALEVDGRTWLSVPRANGTSLVLANGISGLVEAQADLSDDVPAGLRFAGSDGRFTALDAGDRAVVVADGSHSGAGVDLGGASASVLGGGGLLTVGPEITVRPLSSDGALAGPLPVPDAGTPAANAVPVVDDAGDAWVLTDADAVVRVGPDGRVGGRFDVEPDANGLLVVDGDVFTHHDDGVRAVEGDATRPGAGDGGVVPGVAVETDGRWAVASGSQITLDGEAGGGIVSAPSAVSSLAVWHGAVWAATPDAVYAIAEGAASEIDGVRGPFQVFADGGRLWFVAVDGAIAVDRRQQTTVFQLAGVDLSLCPGDCSPEDAVDYLDELTPPTTAPPDASATTAPPITLPPNLPTTTTTTLPPTTTTPPPTAPPVTRPPATVPPATSPPITALTPTATTTSTSPVPPGTEAPPSATTTTIATLAPGPAASSLPELPLPGLPALPALPLPPVGPTPLPPPTSVPATTATTPVAPPPAPPTAPPPPVPTAPTDPPPPPPPPPPSGGGDVLLDFSDDDDPLPGPSVTVAVGFDGTRDECVGNGGTVAGSSTFGRLSWSGAGQGTRTIALRVGGGAASETIDVQPGSLSVSLTVCGLSASISRQVGDAEPDEPPQVGGIELSDEPVTDEPFTASIGYSYGPDWEVGGANWSAGPCGATRAVGSGSTGPRSASVGLQAQAAGPYCITVVVTFRHDDDGPFEAERDRQVQIGVDASDTSTTPPPPPSTEPPPPPTEPPPTEPPPTEPPPTEPPPTEPPPTEPPPTEPPPTEPPPTEPPPTEPPPTEPPPTEPPPTEPPPPEPTEPPPPEPTEPPPDITQPAG